MAKKTIFKTQPVEIPTNLKLSPDTSLAKQDSSGNTTKPIKNTVLSVEKLDFLKQQYSEYYQMLRWHLTASWNIPALTVVLILGAFTFGIEKVSFLFERPLISFLIFFLLASLSFIVLVHHRRNSIFAKYFELSIRDLEKDYGQEMNVYHSQIEDLLKGFNKISSTALLTYFLSALTLILLAASIFFLFIIYTCKVYGICQINN